MCSTSQPLILSLNLLMLPRCLRTLVPLMPPLRHLLRPESEGIKVLPMVPQGAPDKFRLQL
jgi:hypothetical protein